MMARSLDRRPQHFARLHLVEESEFVGEFRD